MNRQAKEVLDRALRLIEEGAKKLPESADPETGLEELHFELTYQCNQKCVMCNVWSRYKDEPGLKKEELTLAEIKRFVEGSRYLGNIKLVLFSGGEPLLRDDIVDLCEYFAQKFPGISIGILSNLYNTRNTVERLKEISRRTGSKNLWVGSSLDGIGDIHDSVRGVGSAFENLRRTIEVMKRELPQVNVGLNYTLTSRNRADLMGAYEFARQRGLDLSAQFAIPWEGAEKFEWNDESISEVERSTEKIIEGMVEEHGKKRSLEGLLEKLDPSLISRVYYWHGLTKYQREQRRFFKRCVAGAKYAMLSPSGDLYFCPPLKDSIVGNIREYDFDFDRLWMSERARSVRAFINRGACHCWLNCTVYPNVGDAISMGRGPVEKAILSMDDRTGGLLRRLGKKVFGALALGNHLANRSLAMGKGLAMRFMSPSAYLARRILLGVVTLGVVTYLALYALSVNVKKRRGLRGA